MNEITDAYNDKASNDRPSLLKNLETTYSNAEVVEVHTVNDSSTRLTELKIATAERKENSFMEPLFLSTTPYNLSKKAQLRSEGLCEDDPLNGDRSSDSDDFEDEHESVYLKDSKKRSTVCITNIDENTVSSLIAIDVL